MKAFNYILLLFVPLSFTIGKSDQALHYGFPGKFYSCENADFYLFILNRTLVGDIQEDDLNQHLQENLLSGHTKTDLSKAKSFVFLTGNTHILFSFRRDVCENLVLDLPPPVFG